MFLCQQTLNTNDSNVPQDAFVPSAGTYPCQLANNHHLKIPYLDTQTLSEARWSKSAYSFTDFGFAFLYVVPSPAVLSFPLTSPVQHMNAFMDYGPDCQVLLSSLSGLILPVLYADTFVSSGFEVLSTHTSGRTWLKSAVCTMHVLELFSSTKEVILPS